MLLRRAFFQGQQPPSHNASKRSIVKLKGAVRSVGQTARQRLKRTVSIPGATGVSEDKHAANLASAMQDFASSEGMAWCSVVKPDLSGRGIGLEGFQIPARVLGQCSSLATPNLGCNRIGDEGTGSLARVQGQCFSLVELNLGGNDIGDHGIAMIMSCPRLKPALCVRSFIATKPRF